MKHEITKQSPPPDGGAARSARERFGFAGKVRNRW